MSQHMRTVLTNDLQKRREFKERALDKVSQALAPQKPEAQRVAIDIQIPSNFHGLSEPELYGMLRSQHLTPEQLSAVIEQLAGRSPRTDEFRFLLELPVALKEKIQPKVVVKPRTVAVQLPADFYQYRTRDQYDYLLKECSLPPGQANDVVDIIGGKAPLENINYEINFSDKTQLKNPLDIAPAPLPGLHVKLPHDFQGLKQVYQEMALTKTYGFSLTDARDILAAMHGLPLERSVSVEFEVAPMPTLEVAADYPEISVELPMNFGSFRPQEQYSYLKTVLKLNGDQANDVIATVKGNKPLYTKVNLSLLPYEAQDPSREPSPTVSLPVIEVTLPHNFKALKRVYQEMLLTRTYGFSLSDALDVLAAIQPGSVLKRKVKVQFEAPPAPKRVPTPEYPELTVELPETFGDLRSKEQYLYLKTQLNLTSAEANDVLAAFNGSLPLHTKVTVTKSKRDNTQEFLDALLDPEPLPAIDVMLPHDFMTLKRSEQEMTLTRSYGFSLSDALDILASFQPGSVTNREVTVAFETAPPVQSALPFNFPEITAELPKAFADLRPEEQYHYAKTQLRLTDAEANDVLAAFNGQTPIYNKVTLKVEN